MRKKNGGWKEERGARDGGRDGGKEGKGGKRAWPEEKRIGENGREGYIEGGGSLPQRDDYSGTAYIVAEGY